MNEDVGLRYMNENVDPGYMNENGDPQYMNEKADNQYMNENADNQYMNEKAQKKARMRLFLGIPKHLGHGRRGLQKPPILAGFTAFGKGA